MKTNKLVVTLILSLAAASAFADGRGTAGQAHGGAEGANGAGMASDLGFFPGWQTASPAKVAEEAAKYPQARSVRSAPAEWPHWVRVASAK